MHISSSAPSFLTRLLRTCFIVNLMLESWSPEWRVRLPLYVPYLWSHFFLTKKFYFFDALVQKFTIQTIVFDKKMFLKFVGHFNLCHGSFTNVGSWHISKKHIVSKSSMFFSSKMFFYLDSLGENCFMILNNVDGGASVFKWRQTEKREPLSFFYVMNYNKGTIDIFLVEMVFFFKKSTL